MKFFISASQVIKNPYPLWSKYIFEILSKPYSYVLLDQKLNEKEIKASLDDLVNFFGLKIMPKTLHEIDYNDESNFLLDFGNEISSEKTNEPNVINVGFIGFGIPLNSTLEYFREIECKLLVSEILPNELPSEITQENLNFFLQNYYFLPPHPKSLKIGISEEKKIRIFIDSKTKIKNKNYTNIYNAISKSSDIEFIDINSTDSPNQNVAASSIITYLLNPQCQLAVRYASPFELKQIDGEDSAVNPLRNIFVKKSNIDSAHLFNGCNSSIRHQLKCLFEKDPSIVVDNAPALSAEEEFDKLINKISSCHSTTPNRCKSIYGRTKVQQNPYIADLPKWLNHFGSEPFLNEILTNFDAGETKENISVNHGFYEFAKDAYFLIHITDREECHSSNFTSFFGKPTDETIHRFKIISKKLYDFGKDNLVKFSGLETNLAYKFMKSRLADLFSYNEFIDDSSYELLLNLIISCNEFKENGKTPKMYLIILFALGNRPEEAIKICEQENCESTSNILYVTHSLCLAMQGKNEESKQMLSNFCFLDSQYAKDYVSVAYLLTKLLVSDLSDKQAKEVLQSYQKRKPSQEWWGIDLIFLALATVVPVDVSKELFEMCKEKLLNNNILTENGLNQIILSPKDHDLTALGEFLAFLDFSD